jgi:chitinase
MSLSLKSITLSSWGGGSSNGGGDGTIILQNNSSQTISNWSFVLNASSNVSSVNFYDFMCSSNGNSSYILTPKSWSNSIPPNQVVSSGFQYSFTGTNPTFSTGIPPPIIVNPTQTNPPIIVNPTSASNDYTQWYEPASGKNVIIFMPNWDCYGRNYQICNIPIDYVPTLAYCFYDVDSQGNVKTLDTYADTDKVYTTNSVSPPDTWSDGLPYHGNLGQLLKLKQAGKKFNLILAVGGWNNSKYFSSAVSTPQNRQNFVNSLLAIYDKYPIFNGVSIDWEYLSSDSQNYGNTGNQVSSDDVNNCILFLQLLRQQFIANNKSHYKITICFTAAPEKMKFSVKNLADCIDYALIMTYDFQDGNWGDTKSSHHTNLYPNPAYTKYSVKEAVDAYLSQGMPANKIFIGVAYYSRGFSNCSGLGMACRGGSSDTSWEQGVCDFKTLPRSGAVEMWDDICKASYSLDTNKNILNSYDTPQSVLEKCKYVNQTGLKGVIVWEMSGDMTNINDPRSLTKVLYENLIGSQPIITPTTNSTSTTPTLITPTITPTTITPTTISPTISSQSFPISSNRIQITQNPTLGLFDINLSQKLFEYTLTTANPSTNDKLIYLDVDTKQSYTINIPLLPPVVNPTSTPVVTPTSSSVSMYIDMTMWPTPSLPSLQTQLNNNAFTLAFIVDDGHQNPCWGGQSSLLVSNKFLQSDIQKVQSVNGSKITISFGGASGQELAQVITDIPTLQKAYQSVIDTYNCHDLNWDIEGSAIADLVSINRRNKTIYDLQQVNSNLNVSYCLPCLSTGLDNNGIALLQNAKTNNVNLSYLAIMTMDFYNSFNVSMSNTCIQAIQSTYNQLQSLGYTNVKIVPIFMIGVNDDQKIFTLDDARTMVNWCKQNTNIIKGLSYWSLNRDTSKGVQSYASADSSGINQQPYDFFNIFKTY